MHQVVEVTAHASRAHAGGFGLKIKHLTDQTGFPEQAAVRPCSLFLECARKVGHHAQAEGTVAGNLLEAAHVSGGLATVPQRQDVERHAARLEVCPSELVVTGGPEGVEPGFVANENVEPG